MSRNRNYLIKNLTLLRKEIGTFEISEEITHNNICCVNPKYFAYAAKDYKGSTVKVYDLQSKEILFIDADKEVINDLQFNPFDDNMLMTSSIKLLFSIKLIKLLN
jgi:hypothetical protein